MAKDELDDEIYTQITVLTQSGDALFDEEKDREALSKYFQAITLLPEPVHQWEAATWIFTAIGDVLWVMQEYQDAYSAFQDALRCPGGIGNPFVHLRAGQLDYELGDRKKAIDELMRAYMGAGEEIFAREDPKYFAAIKNLI